ncbi:aspartate/glutamate racemase family protein [Paucibacter sp. XJ19-41]|uniref:aspartate/glutamate racemase family protein n=1 Tax=Paucibacter sp. XJ19-41 TaxID=2927824 RepID=UPI00234B5611|nr:amino acid racemase [Paucibacter sp. XJ19-41]MDC6168561.1 amino acid racemase [Paucibacter sp. XJ19-41]
MLAVVDTDVVGVLGGMGPLASLDFMHKMLAATPAARDQEHVPVVLSSIPQVPDRTEAFRGEGDSPLAAMLASGRRLRDAGAGLVVMPCNTAHLWFDELQAALGLPMLHLVDAALEDAVASAGLSARIGLLATDATLASGLYLNRPASQQVQWLLPTASEMLDWVMPGIQAVKAGRLGEASALLLRAATALQRRGAAALVLGCTEIPLVLTTANAPVPVIDATAALARRAVSWSLSQRPSLHEMPQ